MAESTCEFALVGCRLWDGRLERQYCPTRSPRHVLGIDPSEAFVTYASSMTKDISNLHFEVADAESIPVPHHSVDIAVSALALNFFPDPVAGLRSMKQRVKPGGLVAVYVWDYAEGMQMLRYFWDAARHLDPNARKLDEKVRFSICQPDTLTSVFGETGLSPQEIRGIDAPTVFEDFDDYWQPFLGGDFRFVFGEDDGPVSLRLGATEAPGEYAQFWRQLGRLLGHGVSSSLTRVRLGRAERETSSVFSSSVVSGSSSLVAGWGLEGGGFEAGFAGLCTVACGTPE
jgi:SAM-dependent methyltransferase